MDFAELIKGKVLNFTWRLSSSEHKRWFITDNTPLQILRDNDRRLILLQIKCLSSNGLASIRQTPTINSSAYSTEKSRGMKLLSNFFVALCIYISLNTVEHILNKSNNFRFVIN